MAKEKPKYEAVTGIDFESLKPPVRVERGELLPDTVSAQDIADLLTCNPPLIKEVPTNAGRSLKS